MGVMPFFVIYEMMLFKDERGVSPIVSALLMIVITVAAFSITYAATNSWTSAQRSGQLLALQERLVVEDVWFKHNSSNSAICVYARNVGKVELEIYSLKVNEVVSTETTPTKLRLSVGFGGWMNTTYNWMTGTTYKIEILTDRGSVIATYATA